jgi:DNA-binding response OmpR family regulator
MKGDREMCLDAGADAYVPKPLSPADLLQQIQALTSQNTPAAAERDAVRERLLTCVGGDEALLRDIAELFRQDAPRQLDAIRAGISSGNTDAIYLAAHTLRGAASNFGPAPLLACVAELERSAKDGDLPACASELGARRAGNAGPAHAARRDPGSVAMRVLIADDDIVTSRRLRGLAETWGYDVVTASDGPSTLTALQQDDAPRLVLLDWVMPGLDGVHVCQSIRARANGDSVYVIMLTSKAGHEDMVAGFDAGVDDFLVKPFDADELRSRLKAAARIVDLQTRLNTNVAELTDALNSVKTLKGMLPICGYCKAIRDDSNYWHQVEEYVSEHTDAAFSHGICPKCLEKAIASENGEVMS